MRERRCIVTGEVLPESRLIRFVVAPDDTVVPDLAASLPGRGMWVAADRTVLERAVAKNRFSKAAKANVHAAADIPERIVHSEVGHPSTPGAHGWGSPQLLHERG